MCSSQQRPKARTRTRSRQTLQNRPKPYRDAFMKHQKSACFEGKRRAHSEEAPFVAGRPRRVEAPSRQRAFFSDSDIGGSAFGLLLVFFSFSRTAIAVCALSIISIIVFSVVQKWRQKRTRVIAHAGPPMFFVKRLSTYRT